MIIYFLNKIKPGQYFLSVSLENAFSLKLYWRNVSWTVNCFNARDTGKYGLVKYEKKQNERKKRRETEERMTK